MNDAGKTKEQLIDELATLRHSLAVEQAAEHIREAVLVMRKAKIPQRSWRQCGYS